MTRRIVNMIDIEATGLNEPEQRIIEHCSMLYDLDTEEHIKTFVWRCNPMRKIEPKAQKAHGIRLDDLANEPTFDAIAPLIRGTIDTAYACVAHNGDHYDFDFLTRECRRVGHPVTFNRTFDTMVNGRFANPLGKIPRLGELAECLDVDYDPEKAHGAEYDVSVMAACFFAGRKLGWFILP